MTRRDLLVASSALVAGLHTPWLAAPQSRRMPRVFMRKIRLQTAAALAEMEEFYRGKLGLSKVRSSSTDLTVRAGSTELTFVKAPKNGQGPLTHFAFNIPQNKIRSALDWSRKRLDLIPAWGDLADAAYPNEVIHFRHWNAHSLFFWDPAFNLVELIARHDLANDASGAFSPTDIQCVSELGLPTKDPTAFAKHLNGKAKIPAYPSGTAPAFAMGDENGLLLCLREGQVWGEHTTTPRTWRPYSTEVEIAGPIAQIIEYPGYPFRIEIKP